MCHSFEMYNPGLTRQAAEHRIGAADYAQAERERSLVDLVLRLVSGIRATAGRLGRLRSGWRRPVQ